MVIDEFDSLNHLWAAKGHSTTNRY